MRSKLFSTLLVVFLFTTGSNGQIYIYQNTLLSTPGTFIGKYVDSSTTYGAGGYAIGKQNPYAGTTSAVYRSYFEYSLLDIPTNATIDTVFVNYSTGSFGYTFKITKMTTVTLNDPQANWTAIGNSSTAHSGLTYGMNNFISSNLKTELQNALASRKLILGALSENETADNSYSSLSLSLTVYYKRPTENLSFVARNDLEGGDGGFIGIGVGQSPTALPSPKFFDASETQTINLTAYDTNNVSGYRWVYNDIEATLNKSKWEMIKDNVVIRTDSTQSISRVANKNDNTSTFKAYLKKNFKIDKLYTTEFDGIKTNPATWIINQNSKQISAPADTTINGRTYKFAGWTDGNANNPRTIAPDNNHTYTALYKIPTKSNEQDAYANNSQRKFVRTPDGWLHLVYSSLNRVWYELSTNNGASWQIMNNGMPLSGFQSKLPAIDFYGNVVSIVWQQINGSGYDIKLSSFYSYGNQYIIGNNAVTIYNEQNENFSNDANPVIGWGYNGKAIILWEGKYWGPFGGQDGIGYSYCTVSYNSITFYSNAGIALTDENSITPTIATLSNISNPICFRVAYVQKYSEESSDIYHCLLTIDASNTVFVSNISDVSSGAGFTKNTKPSMIASGDYEGTGSRLCWVGYRAGEVWIDPEGPVGIEGSGTSEQKVVFMDPGNRDYYWNFGSLVQSTNINISNSCYAIAWGMDNSTNAQYTDGNQRHLSHISTLGIQGKDIQLCTGNIITDMQVNAFNSAAQPYYFQSDHLTAYQSKINMVNVGSGREGVISIDSARFYFALGDLKVNGQNVGMIEVDDTVSIYNKERFNDLLISEPFNLTDNTNFVYSVQYGITDSSATVYVLDNDDFVSFKVELRDDQTNELLGLFDNVTYTEANVAQYNNIAYQVNTQGVGNRTVRLKLVTDNNFNPKYSIADRYAEGNALLKTTLKQVSYQGSLAVDNYYLSQNYPNPFNPTTTINYQLKEDGLVTLKIYDILGSEVKTLVNEEKTQGRYSHNFNASDLASGVYIYQLRVNDFVSSKKLMLLK